ncbi:MAG: alpha/beta fold hydrolase [Rubrivivax sp.]
MGLRRARVTGKALAAAMLAAAGSLVSAVALAAESHEGLSPCWLDGVPQQVLCGVVSRPLNPSRTDGVRIDIHFAVLPALARNRLPDPVFFLAGGPGQSAIDLAGSISRLLARLNNRRDVVLVDQRGTGRSAPLLCPVPPPTAPLAEAAGTAQQVARVRRCREQLQTLPHGDLRHYTTPVAMADLDAVRRRLGADRIDLVGGSYGTRAVLEYMRQFPQAVRRAVIDGVAPPDMVLPVAASLDNQGALDAVFAACAAEPACQSRHPELQADWRRLLARLPLQVRVLHPVTGAAENLTVTHDLVLSLVRGPLYAPALAAALPQAIADAAAGRFDPLLGLSSVLTPRRGGHIAEGMHFSVICSEDVQSPNDAGSALKVGADFGSAFAGVYVSICADWPHAELPAGFRTLPPALVATLVLSGGADPVTPPRHGARVTQALGALARHVVVPQAGHGLLALPCLRDVLWRFIDADTDTAALQVDANCAAGVPRPPAVVSLVATLPSASASGSRR